MRTTRVIVALFVVMLAGLFVTVAGCGEPDEVVVTVREGALLPGEQPGYCANNGHPRPVAGIPASGGDVYYSAMTQYGSNFYDSRPSSMTFNDTGFARTFRHQDGSGQFATCGWMSFDYKLFDGPGQPHPMAKSGCQTYIESRASQCFWSGNQVTNIPAGAFRIFKGASTTAFVVTGDAQPPVGVIGHFSGATFH